MSVLRNSANKIRPAMGAGIGIMLLIPPLRMWMEGDMMLHMLLQIPLIVFAGWIQAQGFSDKSRAALQKWNHAGISGLLMSSLILMFWMLPRALDVVLTDSTLEFMKFASLALVGVALACSWPAAGMIVRGFFLGNLLPMMLVIGWLYVVAPVRICNAYLANDQVRTGNGLMVLAIVGSLVWLYGFFLAGDHEEVGN